nr:DUF2946 family protein [uncultured Pseudomonas sp.]
MARPRRHRHLPILWLTSLALVFAALLPMPGPNAGTAVTWAEMCTSRGYVRVAIEQPADTGDDQHAGNPCLWCSLHCGQAQLPGNMFASVLFVAPQHSIDSTEPHASQRRRTWPAALSRAPPRLTETRL